MGAQLKRLPNTPPPLRHVPHVTFLGFRHKKSRSLLTFGQLRVTIKHHKPFYHFLEVFMNKLIKAFSIVAISCSGASLLYMCAALTVLWETMIRLFSSSLQRIDPVIPFTSVLSIITVLAFATVLFTTSYSKGSAAIEFVTFGVLVAGLPFVNYILTFAQNAYVNSLGMDSALSLSITSNALSPSNLLTGIASSTILVVCGMRIANKLLKAH